MTSIQECTSEVEQEQRLHDVLGAYFDDQHAGRPVSRGELVARHPALASELAAFFTDQGRFAEIFSPLRAATGASQTLASPWPVDTGNRPYLGRTLPAAHANFGNQPTLDGSAITQPEPAGVDPNALEPGTPLRYFGDYELGPKLGRGGMGVVYKARQVSLNRPVALKMLLSGQFASDEELRRFQNEAEAVARLEHPRIVSIYETGNHEGHHYFSMKLISGGSLSKSLARYAADPDAAARLVVAAAEAIHHAHQRGILHRDLKPGNILIDEHGDPHITDFGLARQIQATDELTKPGAVVGTPGYMSPEQTLGERAAVTVASDVYGLGAILYAMFAGHAPFHRDTVVDTLQQVRDEPPEPPSRINQNVPRDLEVICLKCLEKDPSRRYASAAALADDLNRWLRGEPILARPVSAAARLGMWCKRKPALAALSAGLAAAVLIGVAGITWNWLEARLQTSLLRTANRQIVTERDVSEEVTRFLIDSLLVQADPSFNAREGNVTVEELLDRAAKSIGARFENKPAVEAAIRAAIGRTYHSLGKYEKGRPQLERALELRRELHGPGHAETIAALEQFASLLQSAGYPAEAETLAQQCYDDSVRVNGRDARLTLNALNNLGAAHVKTGKFKDAERCLRAALQGQQTALGDRDPQTIATLNNLAGLMLARRRFADAETVLRGLLDQWGPTAPTHSRAVLAAYGNLAVSLIEQHELDEAEPIVQGNLIAAQRVLGESHPDFLSHRNNLATVLYMRKRFSDAEPMLREILEAQRHAPGPEHPDTLRSLNNLAITLVAEGKLAEAEPLLKQALVAKQKRLGEANPETLLAKYNLASLLQDLGKSAEAEPLIRQIEPRFRESLAADDPLLCDVLALSGWVLTDRGHADEAEPQLRDALRLRRASLPAGDWRIAVAESLLGNCLLAQNALGRAEVFLLRSAEALLNSTDADARRINQAVERVARLHDARGETEKAAEWRAKRSKPAPSNSEEF